MACARSTPTGGSSTYAKMMDHARFKDLTPADVEARALKSIE